MGCDVAEYHRGALTSALHHSRHSQTREPSVKAAAGALGECSICAGMNRIGRSSFLTSRGRTGWKLCDSKSRSAPGNAAAQLLSIILVAVGGAAGAMLRFWLSGLVARHVGETFPWGTLLVNVSGAAIVGLLAGSLLEPGSAPASFPLWLALVTGVLGSYTTVSSFSLQTMNLMRAGEWRAAGWNVAISLTLCLGAAWAGYASGLLLTVG